MELFKRGLDNANYRFCEKFTLVFSFSPVLFFQSVFSVSIISLSFAAAYWKCHQQLV